MSGPDVEGVLAGHVLLGPTNDSTSPRWSCSCGLDVSTSGWTAEVFHRAHVAAVLREQIAAWLGSEAAEEAVHEALDPDGYGWAAGDSPSVRETIRALAALVAPSRVPGEET